MNDLYETDTVAWSERQSELLRRVAAGERLNVAPDWPNIAEEIETLARTRARAGQPGCGDTRALD